MTLIVQGKIKRKSLRAQLLTRREASGLVTTSDIGDNFPNLALEHAAGGDCGNLEVSGLILGRLRCARAWQLGGCSWGMGHRAGLKRLNPIYG